MTRVRRRIASTAVLAIVGVLLGLVVAPGAHATAYRYWSYWSADSGTWAFASTGPAASRPADGSVLGWRFVVTTTSGGAQDAPRTSAAGAFSRICGSTQSAPGSKRIALVIDPGTASDAAPGETPGQLSERCIQAPDDATGYDVLRSTGPVRVENGLVCAIDGYPTSGCADVVDTPTTTATTATTEPTQEPIAAPVDTGGTGPWPLAIGAAILAALALVVWRLRGRR